MYLHNKNFEYAVDLRIINTFSSFSWIKFKEIIINFKVFKDNSYIVKMFHFT